MMHDKEGLRWLAEVSKLYSLSNRQVLHGCMSSDLPYVTETRRVVLHPNALAAASRLPCSNGN